MAYEVTKPMKSMDEMSRRPISDLVVKTAQKEIPDRAQRRTHYAKIAGDVRAAEQMRKERAPRFEPAISIGELKVLAAFVFECDNSPSKAQTNAAGRLGIKKNRLSTFLTNLERHYGALTAKKGKARTSEMSIKLRNLAGLYYLVDYWHQKIEAGDDRMQLEVYAWLTAVHHELWETGADGLPVPRKMPAARQAF